MIERVLLFGGPLDGTYEDVDATRQLLTIEWTDGFEEREYGGCVLEVPQLGRASYRRVDRRTFVHCRTPSLGDRPADLAFPEQEDDPE